MLSITRELAVFPAVIVGDPDNGNEVPQLLDTSHVTVQLSCPITT